MKPARAKIPTRVEGAVPALRGDATAQIEGVSARGVLPGERAVLERIERRAGGLRALDVIVSEPSAARVAPPCPYVERCGGCALMHASTTFSDRFKTDRVEALVGRPLDAPLDVPEARFAYRTRARLAFDRSSDAMQLGYREAWGTLVVDVERCAVLAPPLASTLDAIRTRLAPHLAGKGELRLGLCDGRGTVHVVSEHAQPPAAYTTLGALVAEGALAGAALQAGGASVPARFGSAFERTWDVDARPLDAPLGGFSQAHGEHNRALGEVVIALAEAAGQRVLELFAGHGNFTLPLAARASAVTAVELDRDAVACMRANLAKHALTAHVVELDAAQAAKTFDQKVDVVVLDPPREGAHQVARALPQLAPARIVYVSCEPESLARDLAILGQGGYAVDTLRAFDMFPQTPHVEVVVRLVRTAGARSVAGPPGRR